MGIPGTSYPCLLCEVTSFMTSTWDCIGRQCSFGVDKAFLAPQWISSASSRRMPDGVFVAREAKRMTGCSSVNQSTD
jgi:hypothetical protein